jgi:hypothetical protein
MNPKNPAGTRRDLRACPVCQPPLDLRYADFLRPKVGPRRLVCRSSPL